MPRGPVGPRGKRPRAAGRLLRRTSVAVVLLVLVVAAASYRFDLGERWLGWGDPSPLAEPAEVPPPPGLDLPDLRPAPVVAEEAAAPDAAPRKVRRAIARLVDDASLGRRAAVAVDDLSDGSALYRHGPGRVTPASTMKLLTTVAALEALGPGHRFRTTVVSAGSTSGGPQRIVLVGGGDPLLARTPQDPAEVYPPRADLQTLAKATARALERTGTSRVRLGFDTSLFTGPQVNPHWPASYITDDVVSPISPLWADEGRETAGLAARSPQPAVAAAKAFAAALERAGVRVVGPPRRTKAEPAAERLAVVRSAPLAQIVQHIIEVSDNEGAEVLFRHVAIARGRPASFEGASAAVREVLQELGVPTAGDRILDGSGLSRQDRLTTATLLSVLEVSAADRHPRLRAVVANLPVAGFTGSLSYRFTTGDDAGLGRVRAKTGTLTGVHGLAGVVTDLDGTVLEFVAIADRVDVVDTLEARDTLDQIAAALAGCHCSR